MRFFWISIIAAVGISLPAAAITIDDFSVGQPFVTIPATGGMSTSSSTSGNPSIIGGQRDIALMTSPGVTDSTAGVVATSNLLFLATGPTTSSTTTVTYDAGGAGFSGGGGVGTGIDLTPAGSPPLPAVITLLGFDTQSVPIEVTVGVRRVGQTLFDEVTRTVTTTAGTNTSFEFAAFGVPLTDVDALRFEFASVNPGADFNLFGGIVTEVIPVPPGAVLLPAALLLLGWRAHRRAAVAA